MNPVAGFLCTFLVENVAEEGSLQGTNLEGLEPSTRRMFHEGLYHHPSEGDVPRLLDVVRLVPPKFLSRLAEMKVAISGIQVYLGLDCDCGDLKLSPDEPVIFVGCDEPFARQFEAMKANELESEATPFSITQFSSIDRTMAPPGKSTLGLFSLCGGEPWHKLPRSVYKARKQAVTETLIRRAERVAPGLSQHIEVCETATPRTMTRYTGNTEGTFYGFEQSVAQSGLRRRFQQRYPIKGLYQVGAWTFPGGGYIGALFSAKFLADRYF